MLLHSVVLVYKITAAISFYLSLQFFLFSKIFDNPRKIYYFATLSFIEAIFQWSTANYYASHDIHVVISSLKTQMYVSSIFVVFFYLFICEVFELNFKNFYFYILFLLASFSFIVNHLLPYGIRFEDLNEIKEVVMPWGETLRLVRGALTPYVIIMRSAVLALVFWGFWQSFRSYKRKPFESVMLFIFLLIFFSSLVVGGMIDARKLDFIYMAGFSFFALTIGVSTLLLKQMKDQKQAMQDAIQAYEEENLKRKQVEEDLEYKAIHDELTGLHNRKYILEQIEKSIHQTQRLGGYMAIFFIDLDNFKNINDTFGHHIGDEVLKIVSDKIKTRIRAVDTFARLGGDEFCIIAHLTDGPENAALVSGNLLESLSNSIVIEGNELFVSASIGISIYPEDGEDPYELLRNADTAMYKAKEQKNHYCFYTQELTMKVKEHLELENAMRTAIEQKQFELFFQPQHSSQNGELSGAEALVRWIHPELGMIMPDIFIPLAINNGMIVAIDRIVLEQGIAFVSRWRKENLLHVSVAFNVTVQQLLQTDFIDFITKTLQDNECDPQWIGLELTESEIMTNTAQVIEVLYNLNNLGIKISIDDFGTGYSSLTYLKRLPIHTLKIDKTFINDLPEDKEDKAITEAIIALCKTLNLKTVAEGVETKEQMEYLVQAGCTKLQGYLFSKPLNAADFIHYISRSSIQ